MTSNEIESTRNRAAARVVEPDGTAPTHDGELLARAVAEAAWDTKARNVRVIDVRGLTSYTDYLVVCHGTSQRPTASIAEHVIDELRPLKFRPIGIEGQEQAEWVLVDFGDVILHAFTEPFRLEYPIESIFGDAPRLPLDAPADLEDPDFGKRRA
jgi:ribosome-associated protein